MTAGAPWSVKGIDPKAREIAKDLARRSGMTLGEWLNQMIIEGEDDASVTPLSRRTAEYRGPDRRARSRRLEDAYHEDDPDDLTRVARALDELSQRIETAERRSTLAVSGIDQAVAGLLGRLENAERQQSSQARLLEDFAENRREDLDRLRRMEREVSGPRSVEALRALEGALGKVASQIIETEQRTRGQLSEVQGGLAAAERRLETVEQRPSGPDPQALVDGVVARVAERLERAEAQTSGALRSLETSFAHLDERLRGAESRLESDRLEKLASDLSQRVADARIELIQRFDTVSGSRFDKVERALADLSGHVQQAENRSAKAIETMGQEVLRIAQNLNGRMTRAEQTSQAVAEKVGGEMTRIAEAMESRLRKADDAHVQALERLGGEIARISEKLGERVVQAERRSVLTAEDVGERVGRMADKMEARYERASSELADRIRQSEERTAKLLEEARATLERMSTRTRPEAPEPVPAPAPAPVPAAEAEPTFPFGPLNAATFASRVYEDEPAFPAVDVPDFEPPPYTPPAFEAPEPQPAPAPFAEAPGFDATPEPAPFGTAEDPAVFDDYSAETEFVTPAGGFGQGPAKPAVSTKEAIEAARAAARLGARNAGGEDKAGQGFALAGLKMGAKQRLQARLEKEKKREASTLKKTLLATATAVTTTLIVGGALYLSPETAAKLFGRGDADGAGVTAVDAATPIAAVAIGPAGAALPGGEADSIYQEAVVRLQAGDTAAVADIREAAGQGLPAAQFYLGKLYETGEAGLNPDPVEARRWTERAALGGDRAAMHNLGLYYFDGIGGPKNPGTAVQWFRKAADAGLVDSQYNLGRLYEQGGAGIAADPAEAYKWYLIAAASGDAEAKSSAETLRAKLAAPARVVAERAAQRFQAAQGASAASIPATAAPAAQER
ncbi:MAG TPA: Localization factor PodJS [Caulobacteraceae bacterium]|nr:Localization factor PodJS [Caulobacteraceae bacterium]